MTRTWIPYTEPLRATLLRTGSIALVVAGVVAWRLRRPDAWLVLATLVLWFSFGGHWVELWFLNWLRPRIAEARIPQIVARVAVWCIGGAMLGAGSVITMRVFPSMRVVRPPPWWAASVVFTTVELIVHAVLAARKRPNFYSGNG